jgi:C-terminal processing protease CtpA/Prc
MSRSLSASTSKLFVILLTLCLAQAGWAQHLDRLDRERAEAMLETVASDIRHNYYDSKLHGVDWDAHIRKVKAAIHEATSVEEATAQIAGALEILNDSHTYFLRPRYKTAVEYGWNFEMIGNHCFVTVVKPGSDAEAKGLRPGDEVTMINGYMPTRDDINKLKQALGFMPQKSLQLGVVDPETKKFRNLTIESKVVHAVQVRGDREAYNRRARLSGEESSEELALHTESFGSKLLVIKMPVFGFSANTIQGLIDRACQHDVLIIDLRGNGGGSEDTLKYLLSGVLEGEVKIADRVERTKTEPLTVKGGSKVFKGKLIVLVDSGSASASELFARTIQLEKRGTVMGDLSSGATMEAEMYPHFSDLFFGTMITHADLRMKDGKSIEHVGVSPDEPALPTGLDLANHRDPVLSKAAAMAGVSLTPEKAGSFFPPRWPKDWTYLY